MRRLPWMAWLTACVAMASHPLAAQAGFIAPVANDPNNTYSVTIVAGFPSTPSTPDNVVPSGSFLPVGAPVTTTVSYAGQGAFSTTDSVTATYGASVQVDPPNLNLGPGAYLTLAQGTGIQQIATQPGHNAATMTINFTATFKADASGFGSMGQIVSGYTFPVAGTIAPGGGTVQVALSNLQFRVEDNLHNAVGGGVVNFPNNSFGLTNSGASSTDFSVNFESFLQMPAVPANGFLVFSGQVAFSAKNDFGNGTIITSTGLDLVYGSLAPEPIPEPTSLVLLGASSLAALGGAWWRRKRQPAVAEDARPTDEVVR